MLSTLQRNAALFALSLALAACGAPGEGGAAADDVIVLAKADGWRTGLQDAAGHAYAVIEVAADQGAAQQAWSENVPSELPDVNGDPVEPGIYRHLDDVDLEHHALVVYSSGESSSCPGWVEDISSTNERVEVELHIPAADACTDDFSPYRLILAVHRDALPALGDLPIDQVDVPSANLTGVDAQVVAYPLEP